MAIADVRFSGMEKRTGNRKVTTVAAQRIGINKRPFIDKRMDHTGRWRDSALVHGHPIRYELLFATDVQSPVPI